MKLIDNIYMIISLNLDIIVYQTYSLNVGDSSANYSITCYIGMASASPLC